MHGYNKYAKSKNKYPSSLLADARYLNDWMPVHMVELLESALKESGIELKGATIGVLGYAFLENSDDSRNTPTIPLLEELKKRGAKYKIHDPYVKENDGYKVEQDIDATLKGCDAVVLMTKHDTYSDITPEQLKDLLSTKVIIDGRNVFEPGKFISAGYIFKGVGKGNLNLRRGSRL
jgi:UDP-N-acetyl-D-mannosaminuronic acid dehydrogenase